MTRRVVVTGMGTVTPHSDRVDELFRQVTEGVSAVRRIASFDPSALPVQIAAEVRYPVERPDQVGPYAINSRTLELVAGAAIRALADAGLDAPPADDHRTRARRAVQLAARSHALKFSDVTFSKHVVECLRPLWGPEPVDSKTD